MDLHEELASLQLKQIDVEIIEVQNGFENSLDGCNAMAECRVCLEKCHLNKMCNIFDPVKQLDICHMIMSCASVQVISIML